MSIRVLFVSHTADLRGGAELTLLELVTGLAAGDAIEPLVAVPAVGPLSEALDHVGIEWSTMTTGRWTLRPSELAATRRFGRAVARSRRAIALLRRIPTAARELRAFRPDVVVTCTATGPVGAFASRVRRIPHVWWLHEYVTDHLEHRYVFGEWFSLHAIGWMSRTVVGCSRALADHFSPPVPAAKMRVIYPGVDDASDFAQAPEAASTPAGNQPDALRVLLLGSQTPEKGSELAVRAVGALAARGAAAHLRLLGTLDDGYRRKLLDLATALGIADRVDIVGYTTAPGDQLEWCSVLLMLSVGEGFGRVTVEALKHGRPVVGTASGATPEIVDDGVDGLLVEPGSWEGVADALERLAADPDLLRCLSEQAAIRTRSRFTPRAQIDAFTEVLQLASRTR